MTHPPTQSWINLFVVLLGLAWCLVPPTALAGNPGAYWACQNSSNPRDHGSTPEASCYERWVIDYGTPYPRGSNGHGTTIVDNGYRASVYPTIDGRVNWLVNNRMATLKLCPVGQSFINDIGCGTDAPATYPAIRNSGPVCNEKSGGTNPINLSTGNKVHVEHIVPDTRNITPYALTFNSRWFGWTEQFDSKLVVVSSIGLTPLSEIDEMFVNTDLIYIGSDGAAAVFNNLDVDHFGTDSRAQWFSYPNEKLALTSQLSSDGRVPHEYTVTHPDGTIEQFDQNGLLTFVRTSRGHTVSVERDTLSRIRTVQSTAGSELIFDYSLSTSGHTITTVNAGDGHFYSITRDDIGRVLHIIYPDQTPGDPSDNPRKLFEYGDPRFPTYLTGIINEAGRRSAAWTYDDAGNATSSSHATGTDAHPVVYNADGSTTVTSPLGHPRTYRFANQFGRAEVETIIGAACPQCGSNAARLTYADDGSLSARTDQNGNSALYVHDDRGRILSRTEAVETPIARTSTVTWDTTLNKPLVVEQPGRITTYTYDTAGRVLSAQITIGP